ncbi:MAG TPA: tetratricopeptide repeat protein [Terriglobia bacterium]|nr:tetratricopeptide repeat protein [Terriglobia bacterium]
MRRSLQACALWVAVIACAAANYGATPQECRALRKHGRRAEAQHCFESLRLSSDSYLRAEGYWGLGEFERANDEFRTAVSRSDQNAVYRVRWGRLLHERFNDTDAEGLFKEALQRDNKNAQAYLGLGLVSADGFDSKAIEYAAKALKLDPKLVEAHELMANLALEDSNTQKASEEADAALKLAPDVLDAMAVHAAIEVLAERPPDAWFNKIRQVNPYYGQAWAVVAHHLVLNYRYQDAIAYYRKAVEIDPQLWSARSQLGVNLMRGGEEQDARRQLEMCYDAGYRDAATVNTLRLLDSYKNFVTIKDSGTILKLNKNEAELLRPYLERQIQQDVADYQKKYKMTLPGPVQVEVYRDHEDFAVRAMGMPGLGALGVTFGEVVALDSPSAREPGSFNWASALRHELSHVFILTATSGRVPRWFTEGLAVHEQAAASPAWGNRLTPDVLAAVRDKKLLPVTQLDRGFVRPEYPTQVFVSYFQAGRICDYIESRWGKDKLLSMVSSFAHHKMTSEAIKENLGIAPQEFDQQFDAWLSSRIGKTASNLEEWRKRMMELAQLAKNHRYAEILKKGDEARQMYPEYVFGDSVYEYMAEADLATGDQRGAAAMLTQYEKMGGQSPALLKELASLQNKLGEAQEAAATLNELNFIYPIDEDLHHRLGDLRLALKDYEGAIREYGALVAMRPLDVASAQFDLARAYLAAGQRDKAQDHILASLESAPNYRPAQKLLLEIQDSEKGTH